jgi:predicted dinucleotide-binding enzyme
MKAKRMKIAIIGKGNVGSSLGKGLRNAGHEIKFGHRDPKEPVAEAAKWGELIIIAVPHENAKNAIDAIGEFADNKIVIDVMNAVGQNLSSTIVCTTSMAEQTQERLPKALVIKAFNTVFAKNQSTARVGDEKLTAFIAGNSQKAKDTVAQLTRDIGFDPVDCGSIEAARHLESMAIMLINLAYKYNMGADIGYKLVKA